jgi:P27 family predicted phage terminase small subunit
MQPAARQVWQHVMAEMPPGVILSVDEHALRCYCEAVVRYLNAQRIYQESTPLIRQARGLTKNPLHQVVRDNAEQVRMWAHELGLTPAARAALRMDLTGVAPGIAAELGLPPRLQVVAR